MEATKAANLLMNQKLLVEYLIEKEKRAKKTKGELENELSQRWSEKLNEIFQFRALLSSRSNIFVHGPNGSGKTSFVQDTVKV